MSSGCHRLRHWKPWRLVLAPEHERHTLRLHQVTSSLSVPATDHMTGGFSSYHCCLLIESSERKCAEAEERQEYEARESSDAEAGKEQALSSFGEETLAESQQRLLSAATSRDASERLCQRRHDESRMLVLLSKWQQESLFAQSDCVERERASGQSRLSLSLGFCQSIAIARAYDCRRSRMATTASLSSLILGARLCTSKSVSTIPRESKLMYLL